MKDSPRAKANSLYSRKRNSIKNPTKVSITSLSSSSDAAHTRDRARSRSSCSLVGEELLSTALGLAVNGTRDYIETLVYCYKSFRDLSLRRNSMQAWARCKAEQYQSEIQEFVVSRQLKRPFRENSTEQK